MIPLLYGDFFFNKFKNTHIVVQQTSSPSICHSLTLQSTLKTFTLKVLYLEFLWTPLHLHLLPHLNTVSSMLPVFFVTVLFHTIPQAVPFLHLQALSAWAPFLSTENLKIRCFTGGLLTQQRSVTKENFSVTHFNYSSVFTCAIQHSQFLTSYRTLKKQLKLYCI
jgi:hypothetical protein